MDIITNCPKCGDALLNEYANSYNNKYSNLQQCCSKRIDHQFFVHYKDGKLLLIQYEFGRTLVGWNYLTNKVYLSKLYMRRLVDKSTVELPWFDPDFSNMKVLQNKVKVLGLFS